jgi:prepilin-type N-terminal cleavage/methylation domain-containing protein
MKKGFTLTETIVVIIIIGIVSAILIPTITNSYQESKENIIEIRNNEQETINIDIETNEIIQDTTNYKLVNIEYTNKTIYCYWEKKD